jgi:hypothetical protein
MRFKLIAVFCSLMLSPFFSTLPAGADVPNPLVTPIPVNVPLGDPSHDYPQLATQLDLAAYGYVEEEFYLEGTATRYNVPRPGAAAPPAAASATILTEGHPYKTRMIVRRPLSSKKFNGVVIMDWLNVTSGYNLDAMWLTSYAHFLREGYAYVGVSVQRVGIHQAGSGLRAWSPVRYGDLDLTDNGTIMDDSLSFDIWSQAAKAVLSPQDIDPLGGLRPDYLIATGASQSQMYLVYYHNSVHPLTQLFDGYLLYIGTGRLLRTDLNTKVIKLNTENDMVVLGEYFARQPDSAGLRTYEVAGASHVGLAEPNLRGELLVRDGLPLADTTVCLAPALSRIPTSHVANAAYDHLVQWIRYDIAPPTAPLLEVVSAPPVVLRRDAYGNALGGIQLSQHAVPTATNTGVNSGPGFCFLFGSHEPFDAQTLDSLYRNHGQYNSLVVRKVNENLADGFITSYDAVETKKKAAKSTIGK